MLDFNIHDDLDLEDNLDNFKDIFLFLGNTLTGKEDLSEREKTGAFLCFKMAEEILDNSLNYLARARELAKASDSLECDPISPQQ